MLRTALIYRDNGTVNIEDQDFLRLRKYMYDNFGLNLEKKRTLVEGRLMNHVAAAGFDNFHDYLEDVLIDKSGKKIDELITKLTTNYTYFMREETHYNFMANTALPEWKSKIRDNDLRVWSAGCSSGEEAYTAAMVIDNFFGMEKRQWDTTILATDISPRVLKLAAKGEYVLEQIEKLPDAWVKKYFRPLGENRFVLKDDIKKEVIFREFNLMENFHRFKRKFHIIFCRNVMIYFDTPTKAALVKRYYDTLEPGGYLFIGLSETLTGIFDGFTQISPAIYRKG